jgi:hypothetical protein
LQDDNNGGTKAYVVIEFSYSIINMTSVKDKIAGGMVSECRIVNT